MLPGQLQTCAILPALLFGLALGVSLSGCSSETEQPVASGQAEVTGDLYTVRGEVVELPDVDKPASSLQIRHEAINDFKNKVGDIKGMQAMIMPFPYADTVGVDALKVGDKIEFVFRVDWEGSPAFEIISISPLDAATELNFARPAGGTGG